MRKNWDELTLRQRKLVQDNLGLAGKAAKDLMTRPHVRRYLQEFEEAFQLCVLGLMRAAQCYNPAHASGAQFSTYATWVMHHCVLTEIPKLYLGMHLPAYMALAINQEQAGKDSGCDPELLHQGRRLYRIRNIDPARADQHPRAATDESSYDAEKLRLLLNRLPWRQRRMVVRRYGLNGREPQGVASIAAEFGTTRQAVNNVILTARRNLRLLFEGKELPKPGGRKGHCKRRPCCNHCGRRFGHHPKCDRYAIAV